MKMLRTIFTLRTMRVMRFLQTTAILLLGMAMLAAGTTATALTLVSAASRKPHGTAGTYDLPINTSGTFNNSISIEPRHIGAGHLIVFTFDEAVAAPGTVSVVDAVGATIGNVAAPVVSGMTGNEVLVAIADVPDRRGIKVTLTGVTGNSGSISASVSLGFLIGSFSDSPLVSAQDLRACRARAGFAANASSFRYDVTGSGLVSAADIATTKRRVGLSLATSALPMSWSGGGWDLDTWQ